MFIVSILDFFLLSKKSDARLKLQHFCSHGERQFDSKIRTIRTYNGMEFHMALFFASKGIVHQETCVYTRKPNGLMERKHKHILNVRRALKFKSYVSLSYWGTLCSTCHPFK